MKTVALGCALGALAASHPFALHQAHSTVVQYERHYWKGFNVHIHVNQCHWIGIRRAACRVIISGPAGPPLTNPSQFVKYVSVDDVVIKHGHLQAHWTA